MLVLIYEFSCVLLSVSHCGLRSKAWFELAFNLMGTSQPTKAFDSELGKKPF